MKPKNVICVLQLLSDVRLGPDENTGLQRSSFQKVVGSTLWIIGTSRNAILVVLCGILGYYLYRPGVEPTDQMLLVIGE